MRIDKCQIYSLHLDYRRTKCKADGSTTDLLLVGTRSDAAFVTYCESMSFRDRDDSYRRTKKEDMMVASG